MAYKVKRPTPKCKCGKSATYEVFNWVNASCGYYCAGCADRRVKELIEAGA